VKVVPTYELSLSGNGREFRIVALHRGTELERKGPFKRKAKALKTLNAMSKTYTRRFPHAAIILNDQTEGPF